MKDVNFLQIQRDFNQGLIKFTNDQKELYARQVISDSQFLCRHGLMDYSLFLVIEQLDEDQFKKSQIKEKQKSVQNSFSL